jgi:hypothetical protein
MKGALGLVVGAAVLWFFWMSAVWVIRTSKRYRADRKSKRNKK